MLCLMTRSSRRPSIENEIRDGAACRLTERRSAAIMSCAIVDPALGVGGSKGVGFIGYDGMFEVRFLI